MSSGEPQPNDQSRRLLEDFSEVFQCRATHLALAPGRVNLIGEHTDYNDGFVLPMAIDRHLMMAAAPNQTNTFNFVSKAQKETTSAAINDFEPRPQEGWMAYPRGVLAGYAEKGLPLTGFDALIDSRIPLGAGLSSSAAIEVATALMAEAVGGFHLDPLERAQLCQAAEHRFAGVPCGIMDQFAVSCCLPKAALLLDCQTNAFESISLQSNDIAFLIIDSNVKHALAESGYAERRSQCRDAVERLGISSLRELDSLEGLEAKLRSEDTLRRRVRHVISENHRTQAAADAFQSQDWREAGRLMYESHESMRNDYEISCPELDFLVTSLKELPSRFGVFGARMTGGGFGGSIIALVRADAVQATMEWIEKAYRQAFPQSANAFIARPSGSARVEPVP